MGELKVKDKDIVVPGEVLSSGMDFLPAGGAFRDKEDIVASQVGMVSINGRLIRLVPLSSRYVPKKGDRVIGRVEDVSSSFWYIDIGFSNDAAMSIKDGTFEYIPRGVDLNQYYSHGEYIVANIINVTKDMTVELSMKGNGLRKLSDGRILMVNAAKVPRIIGKEASMITMIKSMTDCRIIVGQNGIIWISGIDPEKEIIATEAIELINNKAHVQGLTDEVKAFLEKGLGGKNGVQQEK